MARAFLDIQSKASSGRVIVELYEDRAPKAAANFVALCKSGYKNSQLHRIVAPEFLVQGGDVPVDGYFEDESLGWNGLEESGYLCMANANAPNTNGSQFFITLVPTPWLKDSVTVFGRVIKGMAVISELYKVNVDEQDRPLPGEEVIIERCGEVLYRKKPQHAVVEEKAEQNITRSAEPRNSKEVREPRRDSKVKEPRRDSKDRSGRRDRHSDYRRDRSERRESPKKPRTDDGVILKGRGRMKYEERRSQYRTR